MSASDKKQAVCALIFNVEGDILAVSRKNDATDFGLPGGKVDEGETIEHALSREVAEETGLKVTWSRPIFVREDEEFICTTFLVTYIGNLHSLETGKIKWTNFEEIKKGSFGKYNAILEDHCKANPIYKEGDILQNVASNELFHVKSIILNPKAKDLDKIYYIVSSPFSEFLYNAVRGTVFNIRMNVLEKQHDLDPINWESILKELGGKHSPMSFACGAHFSTNHYFDDKYLYSYHLGGVERVAYKFKHLIDPLDWPDVEGGIWNHDVGEDARKTYNDIVKKTNKTIGEISYACTNDKGKDRKERAGDNYYIGIKNTKYATFVKLCDRIFNIEYSRKTGSDMLEKYKKGTCRLQKKIVPWRRRLVPRNVGLY